MDCSTCRHNAKEWHEEQCDGCCEAHGGHEERKMGKKVEFIESYYKVDGDYEWNDNHGELIRCENCKHYSPSVVDGYKGACVILHQLVEEDDYCSWGEKRDE